MAKAGPGRPKGSPNRSSINKEKVQQWVQSCVTRKDVKAVMAALLEIALDPEERPQQRLKAISEYLDRAAGKPEQTAMLTGSQTQNIQLSWDTPSGPNKAVQENVE